MGRRGLVRTIRCEGDVEVEGVMQELPPRFASQPSDASLAPDASCPRVELALEHA